VGAFLGGKAMFITVKAFTDKLDKHVYQKGDFYPHNVHKNVSEERANELIDKGYVKLTSELGKAALEPDENEVEFPKHKGGGYYELSNGETVQGKDAAIAAEEELKAGE